MSLVDDVTQHALDAGKEECCGLVVAYGHHTRIVRARNLAHNPTQDFRLDPEAWLEVGDSEKVVGIYHSHPRGLATPSAADLTSCEATGLPWYILGVPNRDWKRIEPHGYRAPLLERPYVHGVHDCYAIIRDWYLWTQGIELPDFARDYGWWENGGNLYLENFAAAGFTKVDGDPQRGDVFLIQVRSPVPNHAAVYLGNGEILHHVDGRLSMQEPWGGYWSQNHWSTLRHYSRMGSTDG